MATAVEAGLAELATFRGPLAEEVEGFVHFLEQQDRIEHIFEHVAAIDEVELIILERQRLGRQVYASGIWLNVLKVNPMGRALEGDAPRPDFQHARVVRDGVGDVVDDLLDRCPIFLVVLRQLHISPKPSHQSS